jgi:hypothetical protein
MITEFCEGDPDSEESTCTCGLESMGGSSGTLDQCYRNQGIADDLVGPVNKEDLMTILRYINESPSPPSAVWQAYKKLWKECTWWDDFIDKLKEEEDGEEEETGN